VPQQAITSAIPRITPVGLTGMLVTFSDVLSDGANRTALAFRATVENAAIDGVVETTTSLTSTFVIYDPARLPLADLQHKLKHLLTAEQDQALPQGRKLWRVPAVFEGPEHAPQLAQAAELVGISTTQAVAEVCASPLRVLTIGFAPGLPYLGTLPAHWDIPRQTELTKQVPAGAITVAIRQIVLFPASSPTGWRQIGLSAFRGFRPDLTTPFTLSPGDEVQFHAVSADALSDAARDDPARNGGATWEDLP